MSAQFNSYHHSRLLSVFHSSDDLIKATIKKKKGIFDCSIISPLTPTPMSKNRTLESRKKTEM